MGLETATFISGLVATNPVGATDPKSAGDDHLRLIKATILATFAAITGAVTATHTQLNYLASATGTTGTASSNVVFSASPTLTGTVTAGTINASSLGTSPLNASNLSSGTVPDARFPATLPAVSGANLTSLPAGNLTGSIADARLSSNVPLKNAGNTFTADQTLSHAGDTILSLTATDAHTPYIGFSSNAGAKLGYIGLSGVSGNLINSSAAGDICVRADTGGLLFGPSAAPSFQLSNAGVLSTPHASAQEVGYQGTPDVAMTGNLTLAASHQGCRIFYTGSGGHKYVLPTGTAIPEGFVVRVINFGGGSITINASDNTQTMYLIGAGGSAGDRTLAVYGACTLERITTGSDQRWMVSGSGMT